MERARRNALGVGAALMFIMLTLAVVVTTVALNTGRRPGQEPGPGEEPPGEPVTAPIVFALPFNVEFELIKGYSETELQWNETAGQWQGHRAIKIAVGKGTPVLATYAGTITNVVNDALEGTIVEITHRDGVMTRYMGLGPNLNVNRGDSVQRGQQIGVVGERPIDRKDGPHVKLEVLKDGRKVNPADFIPNLDSANK
jgi:murein DD-endopeptidase MepM/ murein hydrolase activator NlpD